MLEALQDLANAMENTDPVDNWLEAGALLRAKLTDHPSADLERWTRALANESYDNGPVAVLSRNRYTGELLLYIGDLENGETWFKVEPTGLRCLYKIVDGIDA